MVTASQVSELPTAFLRGTKINKQKYSAMLFSQVHSRQNRLDRNTCQNRMHHLFMHKWHTIYIGVLGAPRFGDDLRFLFKQLAYTKSEIAAQSKIPHRGTIEQAIHDRIDSIDKHK